MKQHQLHSNHKDTEVTIQAREGIETPVGTRLPHLLQRVTIQVREGIETSWRIC